MADLLSVAFDTAHHVHHTMDLAAPDPGKGEAPPGSEKLVKILKWVFWSVSGLCVLGLLAVAGKMAISWQRGEGSESAKGLGIVMIACVIAGSASGIVGALM
ncbi:hypothetical protein [Streptomyces alboflavus]|uniref:hypothetical protein n=1 Tax=Streptomyces alboflavus TaxID=67267 RepID=UPI0019606649|nr:hypothetical protein [Streptomyces alboflavus]